MVYYQQSKGLSCTVKNKSGGVFNDKGIWGLSNLGNTWYMNAALQMLWHTPMVVKYFLKNDFKDEKRDFKFSCSVSNEIYDLIKDLWKGNQKSISPESF